MVAALYQVVRAVGILLNGIGILLATTMLYRDRAAVLSDFVAYMRGGTAHVFRVATLVGSMVMVAAQIDYFGVFDIYSTGVRLWLKASIMLTWSSAMLTYVFYATKPCFPFAFKNHSKIIFYLKYGIVAFVLVGNTCYPLTLVATSPIDLIIPGMIVLLIFAVTISAAIFVYIRLLRIVKNHALTGAKKHQTDQLLKVAKNWRTFTMSYCTALVLVGASIAVNVLGALTRPEEILPSIAANNFFDGNIVNTDTYREILLVAAGTVPVYMFTYKAWLWSTVEPVSKSYVSGRTGMNIGTARKRRQGGSHSPPSSRLNSKYHVTVKNSPTHDQQSLYVSIERTLSCTFSAPIPSMMSETAASSPSQVAAAAAAGATAAHAKLPFNTERSVEPSLSHSESTRSVVSHATPPMYKLCLTGGFKSPKRTQIQRSHTSPQYDEPSTHSHSFCAPPPSRFKGAFDYTRPSCSPAKFSPRQESTSAATQLQLNHVESATQLQLNRVESMSATQPNRVEIKPAAQLNRAESKSARCSPMHSPRSVYKYQADFLTEENNCTKASSAAGSLKRAEALTPQSDTNLCPRSLDRADLTKTNYSRSSNNRYFITAPPRKPFVSHKSPYSPNAATPSMYMSRSARGSHTGESVATIGHQISKGTRGRGRGTRGFAYSPASVATRVNQWHQREGNGNGEKAEFSLRSHVESNDPQTPMHACTL